MSQPPMKVPVYVKLGDRGPIRERLDRLTNGRICQDVKLVARERVGEL
jgi:hypothetical protein